MGMRGRVRVDWMSRAEGVSRGVVSLDDKRDAVKSILGIRELQNNGTRGKGTSAGTGEGSETNVNARVCRIKSASVWGR
jgi:hypothetical protein